MSGKVFVMSTLLLVLLVSCAASSSSSSTEASEPVVVQQLLASRRRAPQSPHTARAERRAHLSDEEREIVTKQIMQAISGMLRQLKVC